jgi:ActD protein
MSPTTDMIVGVFRHVDSTVRALEELRAKGYHDLAVYTPVPIHEIEDIMERDRPVSGVRFFTLVGGLAGIASAFIITIWTSLKWGLVTGGKYFQFGDNGGILGSSLPPFVIIAFELMVLFGGIATLLGMAFLARLPRFRPSKSFDPRFTNDRFGVAVHCSPDRSVSVREILSRSGADEVRA